MERLAGFSAERDRQMKVFAPTLHGRLQRAAALQQHFVHYTAAPAAMSVIRNRELWLRNTRCMNDCSEVDHGLELLARAYRSTNGQRLIGFFEAIYPGFRQEVAARLEALTQSIGFESYIACMSEHDATENGVGRLSMWRAYSGACGIAMVIRGSLMTGPGSDGLAPFTGPVDYADRRGFFERFGRFVEAMLREGAYVAELGHAEACRLLVGSYHFAALSTKHPGFAEEREWRMAFTPTLQPAFDMRRSVEIIRGEPQVIYKLPLTSREGAPGASTALEDILEALIIGPCASPRAVRDAFVELLDDAGVTDAAARVRMSDIPTR